MELIDIIYKVPINSIIFKLNFENNGTYTFNKKILISSDFIKPICLNTIGNYNELYKKKSEIDKYGQIFNKYRNLTNPYELISSRNKLLDNNEKAISRAYFKLWEILNTIELLPNEPVIYAALAEAPGGFVQAFINFRNKNSDIIHTISLQENKNNGLKWRFNSDSIILHTGDPNYNDGDLLNTYNILAYAAKIINNGSKKIDELLQNRQCNFCTADGGTFINIGYENYQEQIHFPLFFNEILTALLILKNGGNFILKMYDILTLPSVQLINILTYMFSDVLIVKPVTSRPANSERYIVCKNFKGDLINNYYSIIHDMIEISFKMYEDGNINLSHKPNNKYILSISNSLVSPILMSQLKNINNIIIEQQIKYINYTLTLIKNRSINYNKLKEYTLTKQQKIALEWCNS